MEIILNDDFLSEQHQEILDKWVYNDFDSFAMFRFRDCVIGDGIPYFSHTSLVRPEAFPEGTPTEFRISSGAYNVFVDILDCFLQSNNLPPKEDVYRISVNATFNVGKTFAVPHDDHHFPYRHLLIYLNDDFIGTGRTLLKDDDVDIYVNPKKFRGVCFNKCTHSHEYPESGLRYILVITFK